MQFLLRENFVVKVYRYIKIRKNNTGWNLIKGRKNVIFRRFKCVCFAVVIFSCNFCCTCSTLCCQVLIYRGLSMLAKFSSSVSQCYSNNSSNFNNIFLYHLCHSCPMSNSNIFHYFIHFMTVLFPLVGFALVLNISIARWN